VRQRPVAAARSLSTIRSIHADFEAFLPENPHEYCVPAIFLGSKVPVQRA
jgi:hypothetical protein